jgi:hypothetical protein
MNLPLVSGVIFHPPFYWETILKKNVALLDTAMVARAVTSS